MRSLPRQFVAIHCSLLAVLLLPLVPAQAQSRDAFKQQAAQAAKPAAAKPAASVVTVKTKVVYVERPARQLPTAPAAVPAPKTIRPGGQLARIKSEEAEAAYQQGDYATALARLSEAEKLLGGTSPQLLYQRILATDKLVQPDPYANFTLLQALRQHTAQYLRQYETLTGNESNFRAVYRVSESLKKLPATPADVATHAKAVAKAGKERLAAEKNRQAAEAEHQQALAASQAYVNALAERYKFKKGITLSEFAAYNPEAAPLTRKSGKAEIMGYCRKYFNALTGSMPEGPNEICTEGEGSTVKSYTYNLYNKKDQAPGDVTYQILEKKITANVPAEYLDRKSDSMLLVKVPGANQFIMITSNELFSKRLVQIYFF